MVKKLARKGDYQVIAQYNTIPSNLINDYQEEEGKMAASDKLVTETEERKNALEEYVYETRGKLDDRYKLYAQASEKETLRAGLTEAEDWLYTDEGEDAPKSAYVAKLDALKKIGDPIALRWRENEARPKAAAQLREVCNDFLSKAQNGEEQYSHISDEDKQKVIEKCANTLSWLENQLARQSEKPKNVNPVVTSDEMNTRREDVQYTSASIMNRPKPRAKVETPGTQTPKDDKMDQDPAPEQQEMDVD
jgi:heat shock protein 4